MLAVAALWLVEVGGLAEFEPRPETVPRLPKPPAGRPRVDRLFRLGLGLIPAGLLAGYAPVGQFAPAMWPTPEPIPEISEQQFCSDMTYP